MQSNAVTAVTLTPVQASTSQGNNLVPTIPWAILHIPALPPAMALTTLTS